MPQTMAGASKTECADGQQKGQICRGGLNSGLLLGSQGVMAPPPDGKICSSESENDKTRDTYMSSH